MILLLFIPFCLAVVWNVPECRKVPFHQSQHIVIETHTIVPYNRVNIQYLMEAREIYLQWTLHCGDDCDQVHQPTHADDRDCIL